ncbi:dual specificity phosphatase, catalytic domain containing protein [Acanthamoeba castellanii str. Neff]|uniref:Dual specificity phosphatase, catalytic domain containing protein n=1 Tax=Acanthamoeba castellanii (strain ATCC 30010 / Neff) TaxID=1257118 RepID=L8GQE6_ACACF|nr:dual specificity phosphatase, catalytic domain containing protein [Acanthamoeba castellanii str. Neff]ELR15092.1 dual specificity phosphatase, catalytic domain containing protein [Acanthamoeba castellanii str. Neff]
MASLAEQLQRRREGLKEGQTIVVDRSGRRFVEGPGGVLVPVTTNSPAAGSPDEEAFFIEAPPHPELYEVGQGSKLFIGAQEAATNRDGLAAHNVRHILNVATGIPNAFPNDYTYRTVAMRDDEETQLRPSLDQCFQFIDEAMATGGGVLVHCNAGVSRSASVVIAYLMHKHKMPFKDAHDRLKAANAR